ncbi:MAG: hypothetical protein PHD81_04195 [Candidatus Nanoarchaeia archaeon]|nr:hypothetical protein [Candidatus Nanoarchaeia archaeon]MDD5588283.1 hypothetical protein [Candidatus Nanoarchaeia archaeon]
MKISHEGIEKPKIELNYKELRKLACEQEYAPFSQIGFPSLYFCGNLVTKQGIPGFFFFKQTDNGRNFGDNFQVLKGNLDSIIPESLTTSTARTIGEIINESIIYNQGISGYYLDYDEVLNPDKKTKEIIEKEEQAFLESQNYAIKSKELVYPVRAALYYTLGKRIERIKCGADISRIAEQIDKINVRCGKIFPLYSGWNGKHSFPETNYEIVDFIEGLKKEFSLLSVDKIILSGDRMNNENLQRILNSIKGDKRI